MGRKHGRARPARALREVPRVGPPAVEGWMMPGPAKMACPCGYRVEGAIETVVLELLLSHLEGCPRRPPG